MNFEIPTYVMEKKMDFKFLIALLLKSNKNEEDDYRYIIYDRLNKKEICTELEICEKTFCNKLKYLEQTGIITYKNSTRGLIMQINYQKDKKYYVTVNQTLLHYMVHNLSKYSIKVYLLLKIHCELLNNKNSMTRAFICSQLGYSTNNTRNLDNMSKWTNELEEHNLIKKTRFRNYRMNEYGRIVVYKIDTYYKIVFYEDWLENKNIL